MGVDAGYSRMRRSMCSRSRVGACGAAEARLPTAYAGLHHGGIKGCVLIEQRRVVFPGSTRWSDEKSVDAGYLEKLSVRLTEQGAVGQSERREEQRRALWRRTRRFRFRRALPRCRSTSG